MALRRKVVLFSSSARQFGGATVTATTSTDLSTIVPTLIQAQDAQAGVPEVQANYAKFYLSVTGRTDGGGQAATLLWNLDEQDAGGTWRGMLGSTSTPCITSSLYMELYVDPRVAMPNTATATMGPHVSRWLPGTVRLVVNLRGSNTATPDFTFESGVELYAD